jgi:hypothetical protein
MSGEVSYYSEMLPCYYSEDNSRYSTENGHLVKKIDREHEGTRSLHWTGYNYNRR